MKRLSYWWWRVWCIVHPPRRSRLAKMAGISAWTHYSQWFFPSLNGWLRWAFQGRQRCCPAKRPGHKMGCSVGGIRQMKVYVRRSQL